ncbi:MAG: hypothetical protein IIA45_03725 [Bacteroidetes bacterium]|nr:hypothetical protein [Bacteroidota bacterium]
MKKKKRQIGGILRKLRLGPVLEFLKLDKPFSKDKVIKSLPFVVFLFTLAIIYIWNSHYTIKTMRLTNQLRIEVKELRWEYMTTHAELMHVSKQSEVAKLVEPLGLRQLDKPPLKIRLKN